jgi:flagellar basal-body rod protein FlgF
MDKVIYTAMAGARQLMVRQETLANNLANASTHGFRADLDALRAVPIQGQGASLASRVSVTSTTSRADFTHGAIQETGRDLDVAIDGDGFFSVEARDGSEAYTRFGSLEVGVDGVLRTRTGLPVLGDGGQITVPPNAKVEIGRDGSVSVFTAGDSRNASIVGRLKLANPQIDQLSKGADGLFRLPNGGTADADQNIRVARSSLESSNVNVIDTMVGMIALARQYEMSMKMLSSVDANARDASKLLQPNN